jgi:hypothetical protein
MENTSKIINIRLKVYQGKVEGLKNAWGSSANIWGSIAAGDRAPTSGDRAPSKLPVLKISLTANDGKLISFIKDCGLVGYGGRRILSSEVS